MAISTVSSIDELEREDYRFARKPNGRLKSNFSGQTDDPVERIRAHERYLEQMRQDGLNWRRQGDIAAAERAENQVAWEQADRESTHASRSRDRASDPAIKERYDERMLEADSNADLAEQRQFHSDTQHESRWDELHAQERQEREAQEQRDREYQRLAADAKKPLRDRLQPDELAKYERDRQEYGRIMQRGRLGNFFDKPGESDKFDQRYSTHLLELQEARLRAKETQRERGEEPVAQKSVAPSGVDTKQAPLDHVNARHSEQASAPHQPKEMAAQAQAVERAGEEDVADKQAEAPEVHAADGKKHSPLLKVHEGYRAQVSEDQTSIRYLREKDGSLGFTDRGRRVSVAPDAYKTDPDAMRAAMLHASEKFERFKVFGNREHQEASARMAERLGIGDKVANPELQDIVRKEREQIARERAERAIRDAKAPQQPSDSQAQQRQDVHAMQGKTVDSVVIDQRAVQRDSQQVERTQPLQTRAETPVRESRVAESRVAETPRAESDTLSAQAADSHRQSAPAPAQRAEPPAATQDVARPPAEALTSSEIMKPPGYDERKAQAETRGQQVDDAQSEVAKPPAEASEAQTQKAHTHTHRAR